MTPPVSDTGDLERALREIEKYVGEQGWDQPTRLFALVETAELLTHEPSLAEAVDAGHGRPALTSVEQENLPAHDDLTDLLATLSWPESVHGVAVVAERIVLPADQEQQLPTDPAAARSAAAASGQGHELRVAAAATRSGVQYCLLRLRRYDDDQALVAGENLMAGLTDLLRASLT